MYLMAYYKASFPGKLLHTNCEDLRRPVKTSGNPRRVSSRADSLFVLPGSIPTRVETLLKNFLWSGRVETTRAKVAWDDVHFPKEEGGLGIRKLKVWNRASRKKQYMELM